MKFNACNNLPPGMTCAQYLDTVLNSSVYSEDDFKTYGETLLQLTAGESTYMMPPAFKPYAASKNSLINLNYGDPNNPYTGRLMLNYNPDSWPGFWEYGIYSDGPGLYHNNKSMVYRFDMAFYYLPVATIGRF